MNWRPMFEFRGGERVGNGQVFATEAEAEASALARFRVWTMPIAYGTEETEKPVNYAFVNGRDENIAANVLYEKAGEVLGKS